MTTRNKPQSGQTAQRTFPIDAVRADEDTRTVSVAFSSETPVDRWYGREGLSSAAVATLASLASLVIQTDSASSQFVRKSLMAYSLPPNWLSACQCRTKNQMTGVECYLAKLFSNSSKILVRILDVPK